MITDIDIVNNDRRQYGNKLAMTIQAYDVENPQTLAIVRQRSMYNQPEDWRVSWGDSFETRCHLPKKEEPCSIGSTMPKDTEGSS